MGATLGELKTAVCDLLDKNPELEKALVYDGEGNPYSNEIEVDSGDILLYFEQIKTPGQ